jgi:hypothetical protein
MIASNGASGRSSDRWGDRLLAQNTGKSSRLDEEGKPVWAPEKEGSF